MNLTVTGKQRFLGREIPVIEGGFGEGQRCILVKDVAKIHEMQNHHVNELIKNNIDEFEMGTDLLELLDIVGDDNELWTNLGYNYNVLNRTKKVYLLSERGYITLAMLMKTSKAKEIRNQFKKEYFAMRATLVKQSEYIKVLEEKTMLIGENTSLLQENQVLIKQNEDILAQRNNAIEEISKLNAVCDIPRSQLKKDIKVFISSETKEELFNTLKKESLYEEYRNSRKRRPAQPPRSLFEDILTELGYIQSGGYWLDIVLR